MADLDMPGEYTTLAELARAYDFQIDGALPGSGGNDVVAHVDNDNVTFTDIDAPDKSLLELHPSEVIEQALRLLGITVEQV